MTPPPLPPFCLFMCDVCIHVCVSCKSVYISDDICVLIKLPYAHIYICLLFKYAFYVYIIIKLYSTQTG